MTMLATRVHHPVELPAWLGIYSAPAIVRVGQDAWETYHQYVLKGSNFRVIVPAKFRFDGASIPKPFRGVVGIWDLSVIAVLGHDLLYRWRGRLPYWMVYPNREFTRHDADREMYSWMVGEAVPKWRRDVGYNGVRIGGSPAWKKGVPA